MRYLVAVFVLLLASACQAPPPEMTEAERAQHEAQVRQEIMDRTPGFRDAVLRGDPQAAASFWTSDAWLLETGYNVTGGDFPAFFEEVFGSVDFTEYNFEILEIFVHGDVAYAIYEETYTYRVEGQEPVSATNNAFVRYEKEDGVWKMDRVVNGPKEAPPEG